jgi:hypothetical protein
MRVQNLFLVFVLLSGALAVCLILGGVLPAQPAA